MARKVTIFVGRSPRDRGRHNYLKILERLRAEGAAGATAFKAMASFGARAHVHMLRLTDVSPELPVMIIWIDTAERVERILPKLWDMVTEGLIAVEQTEVLLHTTTALPDIPENMRVIDVMTREVIAVHPEAPLSQLVTTLIRRHLRAVPVMDNDSRVVGIVTSGDLVRRGLATRVELMRTYESDVLERELSRLTQDARNTSEVMTSPVETIRANADLRDAAERMRQRNLRRLPVVDATGRLAGILSRVDLLRAVAATRRKESDEAHPAHIKPTAAVKTIMSTDVPAVGPDTPLSEVVDVVLSNRGRRAVVVDQVGRVLGIIRDVELTDQLVPEHHGGLLESLMHRLSLPHERREVRQPGERTRADVARNLMLTDIVVARETDAVRDVLGIMLDTGRTAVPVVDEADRVIGIVYRADLLEALLET